MAKKKLYKDAKSAYSLTKPHCIVYQTGNCFKKMKKWATVGVGGGI